MLTWFRSRIHQLVWSGDLTRSVLGAAGCCMKSCRSAVSLSIALYEEPSGTARCWWPCCWPYSLEGRDLRLLPSLWAASAQIRLGWQVVFGVCALGAAVLLVSGLCSEGRNAPVHRDNGRLARLGRRVGLSVDFTVSMNFKVHTVIVVIWLKYKHGMDLEPDTVELQLWAAQALKGQSSQAHYDRDLSDGSTWELRTSLHLKHFLPRQLGW